MLASQTTPANPPPSWESPNMVLCRFVDELPGGDGGEDGESGKDREGEVPGKEAGETATEGEAAEEGADEEIGRAHV